MRKPTPIPRRAGAGAGGAEGGEMFHTEFPARLLGGTTTGAGVPGNSWSGVSD